MTEGRARRRGSFARRRERSRPRGALGTTACANGWTIAGAIGLALLAALCFPLVTTAVANAPPLDVAALRAAVAGALVLALAALLRRPRPRGREWIAVGAIGAMWTALGFGGMLLSGDRIGPGLATVIASTQPVIAAVIARGVLRERLGARGAVGLAIALVGTAVAARSGEAAGGATVAGVAFVAIGAAGIAAGNVIAKRVAQALDPIAATGWQLVIGAVLLAVAARLAAPASAIHWTAALVLAIVGLAVPGTAVSFVLWLVLLRRAPLTRVNAWSFLTPVFGLVLGASFYGERVGIAEASGALLVLAGATLAARAAAEPPAGGTSDAPVP